MSENDWVLPLLLIVGIGAFVGGMWVASQKPRPQVNLYQTNYNVDVKIIQQPILPKPKIVLN